MIGGDLDPKLVSFLWGAGGSLGVELIDAYTQLKADPEAKLPLIYKTWYFWLLRIGLTLVAGMLVIAENVVNQPLVEINIGAATPAILRVLTASPPKKDKE